LVPPYRIDADVEGIEWDASADGYRLPTEAEWEHACRAGTTGPRYGPLDEIAWYRGNSYERIHDVGGKQPNAWGLYDMLGNVWDWCWDIYDAEVYGTYRVLRGGGWFDEHWSCRASVRRRSHPTFQIDDVGFRIARTILR
jgi:formylglycine-generating enzyme required for sulfatase activity